MKPTLPTSFLISVTLGGFSSGEGAGSPPPCHVGVEFETVNLLCGADQPFVHRIDLGGFHLLSEGRYRSRSARWRMATMSGCWGAFDKVQHPAMETRFIGFTAIQDR